MRQLTEGEMGESSQEENTPALPTPPPQLFERLAQLPGYTWETHLNPFHSTYDNWHVFGLRHLGQETSAASSQHGTTGRTNSTRSSPRLGPQRPSIRHHETGSYTERGAGNSENVSVTSKSDASGEARTYMPVVARISTHALRIEREYYLCKSFMQNSDPDCNHVARLIDLVRLPARAGDSEPLTASIFESPGRNYLKEFLDFGPAWLGPSQWFKRPDLPGLPSDSEPPPRVSLATFLDFAIGASECLELLHHGIRVVHGELRADAFHFNRETGRVRLINFGSGPRSFENGLTSSGWLALSQELGVKHKLQYIAPEQTGRMPAEPDSRTDIYSLGVIYWTLLTGRPAFEGQTPIDVVQAVLGKRLPSVSSQRMDIPDAISNVVQRMTQKQIEERYHSTSGLKHDLVEIRQLLGEGDSERLQNYTVGTKDVSSFFVLPTRVYGREEEHACIIETAKALAAFQQSYQDATVNGLAMLGSASASNASDRLDQLDLGTKSSGRSSISSQAGRSSPSGSPRPESRRLPRMVVHGSTQDDNSVPDVKPSLQPTDSKDTIETLTTTNTSRLSYQRNDQSSSKRPGSNRGNHASKSSKPRRRRRCEVITIVGGAGLGKSSLIQSTQAEIRELGYFTTAKFDAAKKVPFEPLLHAMGSLLRQIFSESDLDTPYHNTVRSNLRPMWPSVSAMLNLPMNLLYTESTSKKGHPSNALAMHSKALQSDMTDNTSTYSSQNGGVPMPVSEYFHGGPYPRSTKFISVFTDVMRILSTNRLICLCLDGIHLADSESLELVSSIILKKQGILIITTCREDTNLSPAVNKMMHNDDAVSTIIRLSPLSEQHVVDYVAATLQRTPEYVLPLALVCLEKSNGNPFYLRQMLEICYRRSCLWYSWKQSRWEFDLDRIFAEFSSDATEDQQLNASFITKRLQKDLPPSSRSILAWASLLGATFSFAMIQKLLSGEFDNIDESGSMGINDSDCSGRLELSSPKSSASVVEGLQAALQSYILMPGSSEDEFCFSHDRYLHAAASLRECQNTEKMHFIIVRTMIEYPSLDGRSVYAQAQHISEAVQLIRRCVQRRRPYRTLLLEAARKAIESGARPSALQYFETILKLLQAHPWNDVHSQDAWYDETLAMYTETAGLYWHQGRFVDAQKTLDVIFAHARIPADKSPVWILQSKLFAQSGNMSDSFTSLKTSLIELGLKFSAEPSWECCDEDFRNLRKVLDGEDADELFEKPLSTDPNVIAIGSVLVEAISSAFWSDSLLFYQMGLQMMAMHVRSSGTFPQIGLGCMYFAMACIIRSTDTSFAMRMHAKGMHLLTRYEASYTLGRGLGISGLFVAHLLSALREHTHILDEAIDHSLVSGDKHLFLLSVGGIAMSRIFVGDDMAELENYCANAPEDFVGDWTKDVRGGTFLLATRQVARALQGKTWTESAERVLSDDHHLTADYITWVCTHASSDKIPRIVYKSIMLIPLFLYGHYDKAIEVSNELIPILGSMWSLRNTRLVFFYASLSIIAKVRQDPSDPNREDLIATVERYNEQVIAWQAECDANYLMWSCLIEAELNELKQHYHSAIQCYEKAIDHCQLYDFNLELALAFELQAEFFIRRGAKRAARATLLDSLAIWSRMNAKGKAEQLSTKYEWILSSSTTVRTHDAGCQTDNSIGELGNTQSRLEENERQETSHLGPQSAGDRTNAWLSPMPSSTNQLHMAKPATRADVSTLGLDILDLQSILEFNQAISSELQIDRLLAKMTEIILESVGAQADFAGVVIEGENGWCIAASGTADGISVESQAITELQDETQKQVLLYTMRFNELVFVHDLALDDRFSKSQSHKSAMSLPILQGNDLLGVLYLQGQPHSFSNRSLGLLQLFCNQVSISIANALLFRKIAKVSAANASMIETQKLALAKAREAEIKAKAAEAEAMENVRLKEEAAKAKSMFLANVSHELRTPLNGVIGMSELLKGSTLSKEQEGYADSIRVCADTLLTVINDILDFSKLEAGKMKLLRVPLNLKDTIAEVVRALSYTNIERGLQTHAELELDPQQLVMGDPVRIHQIFMNLLSNSYKFTAKGSVTVRAKVDHEDKQHIRVTCSVADTGIGVTQEQVTRLFKPFSQADSSTQRSYGGSGLGLSICKALVDVLGGKIWLESQLGEGTTVFFTLNFLKSLPKSSSNPNGVSDPAPDLMATWSSDDSQAGYPATASSFDLSQIPHDEIRICIAEDNPINQKIAVSFVTKLGFKCEAYSDGLQAVEGLRAASVHKSPFHLCLMDVQMPVLDGYDATRLIRQDEDPVVRGIVVVAMTASAIRGDREKCLQAGMNNYLAKPVRIAVLKSMLEDVLSHPTNPLPASSQHTAAALVRDALEEEKRQDDAEDARLNRPSFDKRMSSRNDINISSDAVAVAGAGAGLPPRSSTMVNVTSDDDGQQNTDTDSNTTALRPPLPAKTDHSERSDETIMTARMHPRDKVEAVEEAGGDGANASDEAVPPMSLS